MKCDYCGKKYNLYFFFQRFCKQKCRERWWNKQRKRKYPKFRCPKCGFVNQLNFYPLKNPEKWKDWKCKKCNLKIKL